MQDKFGKKLEEARIRRGISIRQASDDLKIRADFLLSFENNHGTFDMPLVYKSGFIKLYARYLKLNPEEVVNDFNDYYQHDTRKLRPKEEREHLGRIELINTEPSMILNPNSDFTPSSPEETNEDPINKLQIIQTFLAWIKNPYVKTGLFFGGSLAALTLVAITVSNLIQSPTSDNTPQQNTNTEIVSNIQQLAEQLVLLGDDNIHIIVRQENDKQRLFAGNIDKGHPVTITRKGPVKIHFSDGAKFSIQKPDGKIVTPGRNGVGWIEI